MDKRLIIIILLIFLVIPLADAIDKIVVNETDLVSIRPQAEDPDADNLQYSFSYPLNEDGEWQTSYGDNGEYNAKITVSDGELTAEQDILIVVQKKEEPPKIDGYTPTEAKVNEGEMLHFELSVSDLNNDALGYQWLVDDNIVSNDAYFDYYPGYEEQGQHSVKVVVSDGVFDAEQEWDVEVINVDRALILDKIQDVVAQETDIVSLDLPEFEKYKLSYSISEPIGNDNVWETGYDDAGEYIITVVVQDGDFKVSKKLIVIIKDVDRPPVMADIEKVKLNENEVATIELSANDPDGDEVEYSVIDPPEGSEFKDNTFSWNPGYDFIQKDNFWYRFLDWIDRLLGDRIKLLRKSVEVRFVAESNSLKDERAVKFTVFNSNRILQLDNFEKTTMNEGETLLIMPSASDPDNDAIKFSYSGWINKASYTTNYEDAGEHIIEVRASDGRESVSKNLTVEVNDVNREPVFKDIRPVEVYEDETLTVVLDVVDPDNDSVIIMPAESTVTLQNDEEEYVNESDNSTNSTSNKVVFKPQTLKKGLPDGAVLEGNTFTWTPDYDITVKDEAKLFEIKFVASDGRFAIDKTLNVTVLNKNRPPVITGKTPEGNIKIYNNNAISFEAFAEDPDGDPLRYDWSFGLLERYKNLTSAHNRKFTSIGDKKVKVAISDGDYSVEQVWNVEVVNALKQPSVPTSTRTPVYFTYTVTE